MRNALTMTFDVSPAALSSAEKLLATAQANSRCPEACWCHISADSVESIPTVPRLDCLPEDLADDVYMDVVRTLGTRVLL